MGLLDSVLGAVRGGQQAQAGSGGGMGGLGSIGALLGMVASNPQLIQAVTGMLSNDGGQGGLGGIIAKFQQAGLGDVVGSWVGHSANQPVSGDQPTNVLAYGKRRLLEIAIALACEPRVLLLDEPVAGVPAGEREELLQTVAALPADVSVLLIEHDMDLVFSFAKRMTVLVNGTVLTEGDPEQIANDPQVKAVYLGHGEEGHDAGPPQGVAGPLGGSAAHGVANVGAIHHG